MVQTVSLWVSKVTAGQQGHRRSARSLWVGKVTVGQQGHCGSARSLRVGKVTRGQQGHRGSAGSLRVGKVTAGQQSHHGSARRGGAGGTEPPQGQEGWGRPLRQHLMGRYSPSPGARASDSRTHRRQGALSSIPRLTSCISLVSFLKLVRVCSGFGFVVLIFLIYFY